LALKKLKEEVLISKDSWPRMRSENSGKRKVEDCEVDDMFPVPVQPLLLQGALPKQPPPTGLTLRCPGNCGLDRLPSLPWAVAIELRLARIRMMTKKKREKSIFLVPKDFKC